MTTNDRFEVIYPDSGGAVIIKIRRPWPVPFRGPLPLPVEAEQCDELPEAA